MTDHAILYVLCGLPFAGKSTLGRALAARLRIPRVEIDAINTERGQGLDLAPITSEEWAATYAEASGRLGGSLRAGTPAIFDAGGFTRTQRDDLRALAEGCGAGVCLIYIAVPPQVAIARWQHNRLTGERYDIRDDYFALALDHFEPPAADEGTLVYDASQPLDAWLAMHFPL